MNGYSYCTVENIILDKLNSIFEPTVLKPNVPIFMTVQCAHANKLVHFDVGKLVSKFYPQIDWPFPKKGYAVPPSPQFCSSYNERCAISLVPIKNFVTRYRIR